MSARRERKVVTVLFADLVGFTSRAELLDPEDVEAILRPYHERLRAALEQFGATGAAIEYRAGEPVEAKGKSEPVPVWQAVQATARVGADLRSPTSPLVGRARERELLLGAFERVRDDESPQLVTVVGVPGIGK